jgi:hypothetical protein
MSRPLRVSGRREARTFAANAVMLSYFERFGRFPTGEDRFWQLDRFELLDLIGEIELKLGAAFRDSDIEFLEDADDLVQRGALVLMRARR